MTHKSLADFVNFLRGESVHNEVLACIK